MKRLFDMVCAGFGLLILAPVFLILIVAVKIFSPGPAFFTQMRVGLGGRLFRMFKFRSMILEAEKRGGEITIGGDKRITPVGHFLRTTKLDELPQLWNVLRGEMSLVGPRPEVARYVEMYTPEQRQVLALKPGITDPASFALYDEAELLARAPDPDAFYRAQVAPEKIRVNLEYAAHANLWTDLVLIVATVLKAVGLPIDIFGWLGIRPPNLELPS